MAYPSLEQYTEALQAPARVLLDPELQRGQLKTTGLGLPLALCGGFALTYTVDAGTRKFALRCFHKQSPDLERRYAAISARLNQLHSPYFVPFEFIPAGIRIQQTNFPIVKMAWAQGTTLAEFLEKQHRNSQALVRLRQALTQLASFLERNAIAHGDIQPENVMVSADGGSVQLIDYDGMYVSALHGARATELGQINFQHPNRVETDFHERLDRFAFLTLDVALQALIVSPPLWASTRSEPSAIVFRRNDFLDPAASPIFQQVSLLPSVKTHAENLARVAMGDMQSVPTLADFLQGKGMSARAIVFKPGATTAARYQSAYPVCDATNYAQVLAQVGNRVELIGRIHSVKKGWARNRKPFVFVNFSDWQGQAVKLSIWFDGMDAIRPNIPDDSWIGRWVSVNGLVDPPYNGQVGATRYTHLSITISGAGQLQTLTEADATFRLRGSGPRQVAAAQQRNAQLLQSMGGRSTPSRAPPSSPATARSSNQQLLDRMRTQTPSPNRPRPATTPSPHQPSSPSTPSTSSSSGGWGTWIFIIIGVIVLFRACAH